MPTQYYMRAYKTTSPTGYVSWVVNDNPDTTGIHSGYAVNALTNITTSGIVGSKIENFLKPKNSSDGYFFHINSYDWLHVTAPISIPVNNTGIAIVRGSVDGITPRDYSTIFWNESNQQWKFAYNTNGDGYSIGNSLSVGVGNLHADNYLSIGSVPAQANAIRIPNQEFISARNASNSSNITLLGTNNVNTVQVGATTTAISINGNNISLMSSTGSFGSAEQVVFIANATILPSTIPTGGGILYVSSGSLKYIGSNGTITTLAGA